MNYYQIGGTVLTALIVTAGIIKIELIREIVRKLTSDKEKINLFSILIIIFLSVIPVLIGFSMSESNANEPKQNIQESEDKKSQTEQYIDAGKFVISKTEEYAELARKHRQQKDSIFNATRTHRWVSRIGDYMDNDETLKNFYLNLRSKENICLFKEKSNYFFFINVPLTKEQLDDSLENFKSKYGTNLLSNIDLMSICKKNKNNIVKTKSKKIRDKKEVFEIDCYVPD
jgi:ABC-type multidrug transport system fused ATPase/permease subunit